MELFDDRATVGRWLRDEEVTVGPVSVAGTSLSQSIRPALWSLRCGITSSGAISTAGWTAIADKGFATQVAAWEDELQAHEAADPERVRRRLIQAVEERYLDL
ncbi:MAG TPA: hypothetical protein VMC78_08180 [Mycobacterium sp.]|nr:hypothetical protein [Mycobacterium sp.]